MLGVAPSQDSRKTTRIIPFLGSGIPVNLHLPLLQGATPKIYVYLTSCKIHIVNQSHTIIIESYTSYDPKHYSNIQVREVLHSWGTLGNYTYLIIFAYAWRVKRCSSF